MVLRHEARNDETERATRSNLHGADNVSPLSAYVARLSMRQLLFLLQVVVCVRDIKTGLTVGNSVLLQTGANCEHFVEESTRNIQCNRYRCAREW